MPNREVKAGGLEERVRTAEEFLSTKHTATEHEINPKFLNINSQ